MRVNPLLIKKAAEMSFPGRRWIDFGGWIACDGACDAGPEFNPITSDADAMALERALKKEGWMFGVDFLEDDEGNLSKTFVYSAWMDGTTKYQWDSSDTLLLLKCVSAQCAIPLYLEKT